jgi:hypothetical protein
MVYFWAMLEFLSPTALAVAQDEIMSAYPTVFERPAVRLHFRRRLEAFDLLLRLGAVSGLLPPNNLQIRQFLILAALCGPDESERRADLVGRAYRLLLRLTYDGPVYAEGFSYCQYVDAAMAFFEAQGGSAPPIRTLLDATLRNFAELRAPDGSVPTTDTWATSHPSPWPNPPPYGWTRHGGYSAFRHVSGAYLFIHHNPEIVTHRKNQHVAPDFGHFAFWRSGAWVANHPWYEGWAAKKRRPGQERYHLNVPHGIWNSPLWRWMLPAPSLNVLVVNETEIRLRYGLGALRVFKFFPGFFTVEDQIGGAAHEKLYQFG